MSTCERWLNADELIGPRHKIDPRDVHVCGKPAVADVLERHHEDWTACYEHASEAEREGANVERYDGSHLRCNHGAETQDDCGDDVIATMRERRLCFAHAYEASLEGGVVEVQP